MSYRGQQRLGDVGLVAAAVLSPQIARLDAAIADMTQNWHPTGFYTPDQALRIFDQMRNAQRQVIGPLESYIASPASADTRWTAKIILNGAQKALAGLVPLIQAAGQAKLQGIAYIDAPGLRTQVISAYTKLALALRGFRGVETYDSAVLSGLLVFSSAMMVLHDVAVGVLGVTKAAVQAGLAAGEALLTVPDSLSTIFAVGKWVALGLGGVWLYQYAKQNKGQFGL